MKPSLSGSRRRGREIALQILYQLDVNPELTPDQALRLYFSELAAGAVEDAIAGSSDSFDRGLVEALVRGVPQHLAEIDGLLGQVSRTWRLDRMARLDRSILRLATFELRHSPDVPIEVVINEAVDLAKRFGSSEAPAFINGVLDSALTAGARGPR